MTKTQAILLANRDKDHYARRIRNHWVVWSAQADHEVEFDGHVIDALMAEDLYREKGE